jgi:alkylation response protein AidB-like acyl-CoA dehydrogenase
MNERVSIGGAIPPKGSGPISEAVKIWKEKGHTDLARKDKLMKLWSAAEVNRLTNIRAGVARKVGTPGPEGSVGKLAFAETNKAIYEFVMDLLGADGMLYGNYNMERSANAMESRTVQQAFLRARANSIEGGTSEVMRNILGERVLGLPGDIRVDKDLPWSKVPRS